MQHQAGQRAGAAHGVSEESVSGFMTIRASGHADIAAIQAVYDAAIAHQRARGLHVWEGVDAEALAKEVAEGTHYGLWKDGTLCAVFGICYHDPIIWDELEQGDALYLHRIAIIPDYMGKGLFGEIVAWSAAHARQHHRTRLRMDTWAINTKIVSYYENRGFRTIGQKLTPAHPDLPKQNHDLLVTLLEMTLEE